LLHFARHKARVIEARGFDQPLHPAFEAKPVDDDSTRVGMR
jgi:hypothetical protein